MPQFCTVFYKQSLFFSFCSCCTFLETPLLLPACLCCGSYLRSSMVLMNSTAAVNCIHQQDSSPDKQLAQKLLMYCTVDSRQGGFAWGGRRERHPQLVCKALHQQTPRDTEEKHNSLCAVSPMLQRMEPACREGTVYPQQPHFTCSEDIRLDERNVFPTRKNDQQAKRKKGNTGTICEGHQDLNTCKACSFSISHIRPFFTHIKKSATQPKSVLVWILVLRTA